jgi:hypothetical protein
VPDGGQTGAKRGDQTWCPDGMARRRARRGRTGCPTGGQTGWPDGVPNGWPDGVPNGAGWGARRGPDGVSDGARRGAQWGRTGCPTGARWGAQRGRTGCPTGPDGCHVIGHFIFYCHVIGHVIFECHVTRLGWQGVILLPTLVSQR